MWAFSGGMLMLGILLGVIGRHSSFDPQYYRLRLVLVAALAVTVILAATLPLGTLKFILVVLQAPLLGLALSLNLPARGQGTKG